MKEPAAMECPKCKGQMEMIIYNGIEIDRCEQCHGLWFDHLEKEDLKNLEGSESIDVGDEFMGAARYNTRYNQIREITCPKCQSEMRHIVNHDPWEIHFESCPKCHGSFFDAGEFRDYMEDQIFQQFQRLIADINP